MRKKLALITIASLVIVASPHAFAEETSVDRATRIEQIKARWNPLFDQQYLQLTSLAGKAKLDPKVKKNYDFLLADFIQVRKVINDALASATGDVEAANAYAEEETGEFMMTIPELAKQVASIKTITCVKGKTTKKVTAAGAKCPAGFKKK